MASSVGRKAILAALLANGGIAIAKFIGYLITGSGAMLAEAIHSVADTSNQGLLLLGQWRAKRQADLLHPFGYGRARYFYAFVVALVLFTLGSMFAIFEGVQKLRVHEGLESPSAAIVVLSVAIVFEIFSMRTAIKEASPLKGEATWWEFIRNAKTPELPVVLLEDAGALIGLLLALCGVGLTVLTGNPLWDAVGTICIGVLLGAIAIVLVIEMKSLLIGEGVSRAMEARLLELLVDGSRIDRVIHMKTQYLGPEELLVAAKVGFLPGLDIEDIARAIDDAERRIRAAVPAARIIYIEPDLYRSKET